MTFYILMNQITTVFISMNLLTTLSFDSEIESYLYGGTKQDLFIEVTNKMKTLALKPKKRSISSNLLVITKNRKYYFNISYSEKDSHQFVDVKNGEVNHAFTKMIEKRDYEILEGATSILFVNKRKTPVTVNNVEIISKHYLSKGVPLIRDGIRIYN